jgi:hypothetical protein
MMLDRLAFACCVGLFACSTTFIDPAPTRDLELRVFNGSTSAMSNIRINGGAGGIAPSIQSLAHSELSGVITVKSGGLPLSISVDALLPTKRTLSANATLLTDAQLSRPPMPMILTLRFEGEPARLVAELSQPVED